MSEVSTQKPELISRLPAAEWRPRQSRGPLIAAIAALLAFAVFAGCSAYALGGPIAMDKFAAAVLALAALLFALLAAFLAYSSYSARYRIDEDALTIEWLWVKEIIPLAQIDGMYKGHRLGTDPRVEGLVWPGHYVGRTKSEELGWVKFLGTSVKPEDEIIVATSDVTYALTPENLEGFRGDLIERLESIGDVEVDEAATPVTVTPWVLQRASSLRDGSTAVLLASALVILLVAYGYISAVFPSLPQSIPLHFNQAGEANLVGPPGDAFRIPLIGSLILIANSLIVLVLQGHLRNTGRLLAGATLFVELTMLVAVMRVVQ